MGSLIGISCFSDASGSQNWLPALTANEGRMFQLYSVIFREANPSDFQAIENAVRYSEFTASNMRPCIVINYALILLYPAIVPRPSVSSS